MAANARIANRSRFKRVGLIAVAAVVLVPLLVIGVGRLSRGSDSAMRTTNTSYPATMTAPARPAGTAAAATSAPSYGAAAAPTAAAGSAAAPAGSTANVTGAGRSTASDAVGASVPVTPSGADQLIIRTAAITLTVKDVAGTQAQIWGLAEGLGGFVTNSSATGTGDDIRGQITLRVPTQAYGTAMDRLRQMAVKVESEKSDAQDVSEEYVDLQARRTNLELTVQQLQGFLGQAKTVDEALKVQSQLNIVQNDLERVKGRMGYLENRANFSTITATLQPVVEKKIVHDAAPSWSLSRSVRAQWQRSLHGLQNLADALIAIVVGGWWLLLPLIAAVLVWIRWSRRRRTVHQPAAATVPVAPAPPGAA
jgi:hypothetical protein